MATKMIILVPFWHPSGALGGTLLDKGTGSTFFLETLARTRRSMPSLSFRARACVSDKGVIGVSKQGVPLSQKNRKRDELR